MNIKVGDRDAHKRALTLLGKTLAVVVALGLFVLLGVFNQGMFIALIILGLVGIIYRMMYEYYRDWNAVIQKTHCDSEPETIDWGHDEQVR